MLSSTVPVDLPWRETFVIRYRIAEKVASRMHKLYREFLSKHATLQAAGMKTVRLTNFSKVILTALKSSSDRPLRYCLPLGLRFGT